MEIPMLKIRRSPDRLIFNMGIPILVRRHIYVETVPQAVLCFVTMLVGAPFTNMDSLKSEHR